MKPSIITIHGIDTPNPCLAPCFLHPAPSTFGLEDDNLFISWPTTAGHTYQVQRATDLESWENIGVALTGNGTTMSYAQPSTADRVFLRVVVP